MSDYNATLSNKTEPNPSQSSQYVGYAFTLVIIFGFFGNVLVIFCILRQKILLESNHYYVVLHLAVCDLLSLFSITGRSYVDLTGKHWVTSPELCKMSFVHGIFFTAGVFCMLLMALLRYRAVFHPLRLAVSRWKLHLVSAIIYFLAFACQVPLAFVFNYTPPDKCLEMWPSETLSSTYNLFRSSVQFFIPVVALGVIYWKICKELLKQGKIMKSVNAAARKEIGQRCMLYRTLSHHRNAQTFFISFVIFICFSVSGCPRQVTFILHAFGLADLNTNYYQSFRVIYYFAVSALNPFIYGALDKKLFSNFKFCKR